jgi:hypothetical protein
MVPSGDHVHERPVVRLELTTSDAAYATMLVEGLWSLGYRLHLDAEHSPQHVGLVAPTHVVTVAADHADDVRAYLVDAGVF